MNKYFKENLLATAIVFTLSGCGGGGGGGETPSTPTPTPDPIEDPIQDPTVVEKVSPSDLPVELKTETLTSSDEIDSSSVLTVDGSGVSSVKFVSAGVSKYVEPDNSPVKGGVSDNDVATMLNSVNKHIQTASVLWGYNSPLEFMDVVNADSAIDENLLIDTLAYESSLHEAYGLSNFIVGNDTLEDVIALKRDCSDYSDQLMCGAQTYFDELVKTDSGTLELASLSESLATAHSIDPTLITVMASDMSSLWMASNINDASNALSRAHQLHTLNEQGVEIYGASTLDASYADGSITLPHNLYTANIDNRLINSSIQSMAYDMVTGESLTDESLFEWLDSGVSSVFSKLPMADWSELSQLDVTTLSSQLTAGESISPEVDAAIVNYLLISKTEAGAKANHTALVEWIKSFKTISTLGLSTEDARVLASYSFEQMGLTTPDGEHLPLSLLADVLVADAAMFAELGDGEIEYNSLAYDDYGLDETTFAYGGLDSRSDTGASDKDKITKDNTPIISGFADKNAIITIRGEGLTPESMGVDERGFWEIEMVNPISDGTQTIVIDANIPDAPAVRYESTFVVDTQINLSVSGGDKETHTDISSKLHGAHDSGDTLKLKIESSDGTVVFDGTPFINGEYWSMVVGGYADDTYSWSASSIDIAGNEIQIDGFFTVRYVPPYSGT